jgi:short-subunit dehydrogenase
VLAAHRADRLAALSEELAGALALPTDVTDPAQVRDLVAAALDRHQRIDGLVNNGGASLHGPMDQVDLAELSQILRLNVVGLLTVTQAVPPAMRERHFGRIVNISSGTTRRVAVGLGGYASTKSAVNMLSAVLRQELAGDGIAVSLLLPSITATEFGDGTFTLGASPGRAWWRTARITWPTWCCGCCAPARSRSTSPTARSSPTSPGCPADPPDRRRSARPTPIRTPSRRPATRPVMGLR